MRRARNGPGRPAWKRTVEVLARPAPVGPLPSGRDLPRPDRAHHHARAAPRLPARVDREGGSASFLQTPAWGAVKSEWRRESLGWFRRRRRASSAPGWCSTASCPRSSATSPTCPRARSSTGTTDDLGAWLDPMVRHLERPGRLRRPDGPAGGHPPLERRPGQGGRRRRRGAPPRRRAPDRADAGRRPRRLPAAGARLAAAGRRGRLRGRPAAVQLPDPAARRRRRRRAPRTTCSPGMNQLWRRNIKKAAKAGVEVTARRRADGPQGRSTTSTSHTAERDHFTPRPLSYFETMFDALRRRGARTGSGSTSPTTRATWSRPPSGSGSARHAWYSYGASSTEKRDVRGSNAVQWAMIRDALAAGRRRLRPARHHRHPRRRRPARRADPVQGRHRRRGRRVRRRVGPAAQPRCSTRRFDALHEAAAVTPMSADPVRRRRPLARAPAARSRDAHPGHRAGRQGQRLRLRPGRLARKAAVARRRHRSPSGTYDELARGRRSAFAGDAAGAHARGGRSRPRAGFDPPTSVIHTVSRLEDLAACSSRAAPAAPRVVLERLTSMRRHGFSAREPARGRPRSLERRSPVEGVALHLPLARRART